MAGIYIAATGRGVPEQSVTNNDLSKIVDTNDEWISTRTGIKSRFFCKEETNWQLAFTAAKKAIAAAGIDKNEIGLLIVSTFTPDFAAPSVACMLQKELGLENIPAFDLNAACSGFLYGLSVADAMLTDDKKPYALVIGSEKISSRLDMTDRNTCVLFGDGAGAALVKKSEDKKFVSVLGADGNVEALGCSSDENGKTHIYMDGRKVFKFAVHTITKVTKEVLEKAEITIDDVDYVVCHQANERIIKSVMKQLDAPEEKFFINIQKYGNTSAASIPLALDEMNEQGLLKPGMKIVCTGFGAGFTWGAAVIEI